MPGPDCGNIWRDQRGVTTLEYALLLALVALCAVVGWQSLGMTTANMVRDNAGQIPNGG